MFNKIRGNLSSIILMIIFIVMGIAQYIFYNQDIEEYKTEVNSLDSSKTDLTWSLISSTYDTVQVAADEKAERTAKSIVSDIQQEYPDLSVLKLLLDKGNIQDTKLPFIIYHAIHKQQMFGISNGNNDCFVMSRDGYLMDSNLTTYNRSWHSFKEEKNIDAEALYLTLEMINGVNDKSIIYTSKDSATDTNRLHHGTKDDIKSIFYSEGIDGLKNLTFFGKSYITETGDIFGTDDISKDAIRVNNHKLIVVQKFNMYDIIKFHHGKDIELNNKVLDNMKHELEKSMFVRSITYSGLLILNVIAMLVIIFWSSINSKFVKK